MKIIRFVFYLILNIAISAGSVWLAFTFLTQGNNSAVGQTDSSNGFSQSDSTDQNLATVVPDRLIIDSIISHGNIDYERVTILHVSGDELSISGWKLTDSGGNIFIFPPLELYPGSAITINSRVGNDTVTELFWGAEEPIWESGEMITLTDPAGYPQAMYVIP